MLVVMASILCSLTCCQSSTAGSGQCGTVLNLCDPKLEKDNQMLSLRNQGQHISPQIQKFNRVLHLLAQLNSWDTWPSIRVGQHPQNCECAWCQ